MDKLAALSVIGMLLAGCAGAGRESACEVFSPACAGLRKITQGKRDKGGI